MVREGEGAIGVALISAGEDEVICFTALYLGKKAVSGESLRKIRAAWVLRSREAFSLALRHFQVAKTHHFTFAQLNFVI